MGSRPGLQQRPASQGMWPLTCHVLTACTLPLPLHHVCWDFAGLASGHQQW